MPKFFEDRNREIIDWSTIREYREEGTVSGYCMALAECHKLLNNLLSDQGFQGKIEQKIGQARDRFTELRTLLEALETWRKIFQRYDQKVTTREVEKAISGYQRAIYDLSSDTDYSQPGVFERIRTWVDLYLIKKPANRQRVIRYFLLSIIFILVLDNSHFGQKFVGWLANLFRGIVIWVVAVIIGLIAIILIISGIAGYMEERK